MGHGVVEFMPSVVPSAECSACCRAGCFVILIQLFRGMRRRDTLIRRALMRSGHGALVVGGIGHSLCCTLLCWAHCLWQCLVAGTVAALGMLDSGDAVAVCDCRIAALLNDTESNC
jgi:hypothetical protein